MARTAKADTAPKFGLKRALAAEQQQSDLMPGEVAEAEAGWRYVWFDPSGMKPGKAAQWRQRRIDAGAWPVNGPMHDGEARPEYVPSCPTAEIWRYSPAAEAHRFNKRLKQAMATTTWLQMQRARLGRGWRPEHDLKDPAELVPEGLSLSDFPDSD